MASLDDEIIYVVAKRNKFLLSVWTQLCIITDLVNRVTFNS
jgi:hypothetical protein